MARPPGKLIWWRALLFMSCVALLIYEIIPFLSAHGVPFIVRAFLLASLFVWGYRFGPLLVEEPIRDDRHAPIESDHG